LVLAAEENYVRVEENMRSTNQEAFPLLETKRLILRQMRPEDARAIFRIYGDEASRQIFSSTTNTFYERRKETCC